ncbi:MAG: anti-sigma regulatory factor (Ser/Thr protein kinase) [Bryobacterales bacterium]|nr:anti-sigma regulatory factor (Ser/Thr protein kinase) [Bryobacterales bacterium]
MGRVALVATEAATNLFKHGRNGEVMIRSGEDPGEGIEILALDHGPGFANLGDCMRDGYSTAGSPGTGLGAMRRASSAFDIHSVPGRGTVLVSQIRPSQSPGTSNHHPKLEVSGVSVPKPGEEISGDGWAIERFPFRTVFLVADGLGHGPDAARAAAEAVRVFRQARGLAITEIIGAIHDGLRPTRGAAVAVLEADMEQRIVRFVGIGNIAGALSSATGMRQMVSHHGIAGHQVAKVQEFSYPWPGGALIVMHTDGLISRWNFSPYPGLTARHPGLIAGVLYRDFNRGKDDVTVVIAKEAESTQ